MKQRQGLLFGPLAAILLAAGIGGLPLIVPGYNAVHQTVSEIGEVGSPAHVPFALVLYAVAGCLLIFAWALAAVARDAGCSSLPAWLVGCMTVTVAALGWFAYPHPMHNVIGPTELIGYQAPVAIALTWRRAAALRPVAMFSAWIAILLWLAIIANLCVLDPQGPLLGVIWAYERPFYGLVQRSLFLFWCIWCAGSGLWLWTTARFRSGPQ